MCRELCKRLKSTAFTNNLRYKIGQKWCSLCVLFFFTEENTGPCCKTRLGTKARNKKYEMPRM